MGINSLIKKIIACTCILLALVINFCLSQSYKDIMDNGIYVKPEFNIYLKFEGKVPNQKLKYNFTGKPGYTTLDTSTYFIIKDKRSVNVFIVPVNPINFLTKSEYSSVVDQIQANFNNELDNLIMSYRTLTPGTETFGEQKNNAEPTCDYIIKGIIDQLDLIKGSLADNKIKDINAIFTSLEGLDFDKPTKVKNARDDASMKISKLIKHYSYQDSIISKLEESMDKFTCYTSNTATALALATETAAADAEAASVDAASAAAKAPKAKAAAAKKTAENAKNLAAALRAIANRAKDNEEEAKKDEFKTFTMKTSVSNVLERIRTDRNKQMKQLEIITNIKSSIDEVYAKAIIIDENSWHIELPEVPIVKGEISYLKVELFNAGFNITDNNINQIDETLNKSYIVKFRKFQRYIPEVSSGIAYVNNLNFRKYGTTFNEATNQHIVTDAGTENIRRFNATTMLNFYNYRYGGENIYPFIQIGGGTNLETPSLFLGGGLNIFGGNLNNLSISVGGVGLFRRELNNLKIGDVISGTADLEKDLSFQPKIRWYLSLQWHLKTL